jgi:hypothetical protein
MVVSWVGNNNNYTGGMADGTPGLTLAGNATGFRSGQLTKLWLMQGFPQSSLLECPGNNYRKPQPIMMSIPAL